MSRCEHCKYFSPRGRLDDKDGFIQNTNARGDRTGWCQYASPGENGWPTVADCELCGQFVEGAFPHRYKEMYEDAYARIVFLKRQLGQRQLVHAKLGELAPLVGKTKRTRRATILKAIEKRLSEKKGEEAPAAHEQSNG